MIKQVDIENFQVLEGSWSLHPVTQFAGHNGSGKTGLGRAIFWAYTGRDISGQASTDHYVREKDRTMLVRLTTDNGTEIERRQVPSGSKSIKVNGQTFTQEQFEKMLPVPWQVFGSIFLVGFFDNLTEMEKREIFMRITPEVDRNQVFAEMVGLHPSKVSIDWNTPTKKLHEAWKQKVKDSETFIATQQGRLSKSQEQLAGMTQQTVIRDTSGMEAEAQNLNLQLSKINHGLRERDRWESTRVARENAVAQAAKAQDHNTRVAGQREELQKQERDLSAKLQVARDKVGELRTKLMELKPANIVKKGLLEPGPCPTCAKQLSPDYVKKFNKEKMGFDDGYDFEAVAAPVKKEFAAAELDVNELNTQHRQVMTQLAGLAPMMVPTVPELTPEPLPVDTAQIKEIQQKISAKQEEIGTLKAQNMAATQARAAKEKLAADIDKATQEIKEHQDSLVLAQKITEALHPVRGIDAKVLEIKMAAVKCEGIEFVVRDFQKNGEPYDCFKVKVNGIPYANLSEGQKIKTSLAVAKMIDDLSGNKVRATFVDNVELVDNFEVPARPVPEQLLITRVTKGPLAVTALN